MKILYLTVVFLLAASAGGRAQTDLAEVVKQLQDKYPSAEHRQEYRIWLAKDGGRIAESRYDFRLCRDVMDKEDVRLLTTLCEQAYQEADPAHDKTIRYAYGDSVSSTIVYNARPELRGQLLSHGTPVRFWGYGGYLLFDAGRFISVVTDRVMQEEGALAALDLAPLDDFFAQSFTGRSVVRTPVRYSGSGGEFVFQRGTGRGWTAGTRFTVRNVTVDWFEKLKSRILAYSGSGQHLNLIVRNRMALLMDEAGKELRIAALEGDTLHYLRATVEDEPCVPADWTTLNFFRDGETDYVDVARLDSLYDALSRRPGVRLAEVRYTGGFSEGCKGFTFQRGSGSGWTKGTRIELQGMGEAEAARILDVFRSYEGVLGRVVMQEDRSCTYEEGTRTAYAFAYRKDSGRAFFLKAETEGEICVPADWDSLDCYKGSTPPMRKTAVAASPSDKRTQRLVALGRLWAEAKYNFVFMDRATVDWDSLYAAMLPQMEAAGSDYEAVRLLQRMAASLHDGHTYVWSALDAPVPMQTRYLGGKVYVDRVLSSALAQQGVRRGMELTAIDGQGVDNYVREHVVPYAASSTPQWLDHVCYEGYGLTTRRKGDTLRLTFRDGKKLLEVTWKIGSAMWDLGGQEPALSFSLLRDGRTGYLRISSFGDSNLTTAFDRIYPDLLRTESLVIDLRGNAGGNSGNADHILRHLTADSIRTASWRSPLHVPAFKSWGLRRQWHESPSGYMQPVSGKPAYEGQVVVLVDGGTFSAAEDFCALFRGMKRGLLVGQPTGGSTGNGVKVELLPGVAWANICSKHDLAPDGTDFVGRGFVPDVFVEEDYRSSFIDKQDRAVTVALKLLSEQDGKQ